MTRRLSLNPNLSDVISNLAADRNGLDSVAALLDMDGDRRTPSNNNLLDRSSSRSRMAGPTSVEDEVRSLFRPRAPFSRLQNQRTFTYGLHNDRRQRQQIQLKCGSGPFVKDLVLIPDPRIELVPRQGIKLRLIQNGFYKQGVQFRKEWSYEHILQKIRDVFHDKLTDSCRTVTFSPSETLPPSLEAGQQMTGYFITKICKDKPLYVRTSIGLLANENEILQSVGHDVLDTSLRFENGLQTMGLVDEIKKNKKQWKEVFIFTIKPLDALQLDNMFDVKWSTEGSNRKRIEERILVYWRDFLQDLEGQGEVSVTLKDLLAFTTGADEVPALGFNLPLQLSFTHPEDLQDVAQCYTAGFPYANTCTMELKIPVVNDYNTFQRNMAAAISMTVTFTNQ